MLGIDKKEVDGITVLSLNGRLVVGDESSYFTQCLKQLVSEKKTRILVHIEGVTFIDSCGIADLIASFTALRKNGGTMKLSGPKDHVLEVLRIVRMPSIIEIYDTQQEAIASFA